MSAQINNKTFDGVKDLASSAADMTRALMNTGAVSQGAGEQIIESAGGYWNLADQASKQSSGNSNGAAANAANSEVVDQHQYPLQEAGHIVVLQPP